MIISSYIFYYFIFIKKCIINIVNTSMLSTQYFTLVCSQSMQDAENKNTEITYYGYVPNYGHPICLYSEDGVALAALDMRFQNKSEYNNGENSFIMEIPKKNNNPQHFEGIITKNDQPIEFVITNLTGIYLNFNISKYSDNNNIYYGKDNDNRINEVNELRPYETFEVKSDVTNENKIMKLMTYKNDNNEKVLLKDAIKNGNIVKPTNTTDVMYLYISVSPQNSDTFETIDKGVKNKFKNATWKCIDNFILSRKITRIPLTHTQSNLKRTFRRSSRVSAQGSDENMGTSCQSSQSSDTTQTQVCCNNDEKKTYMNITTTSNIIKEHTVKMTKINETIETVCNTASVGFICHSEETFKTETSETSINYDYENTSHPCILGLSVIENISVSEIEYNDVKSLLLESINSIVVNSCENYMKDIIVYNNDVCCVCLNKKPDVLFYKCGHMCVDKECSTNIKKCPLCRDNIYAKIPTKILEEKNII